MKRLMVASIVCGAILLCGSQEVQAQELFGINLDPFNILSSSDDSYESDDNILMAPLMILQPLVSGTVSVTNDTANLYMDLHPGWYLAEEWGIVERNRMFGIFESN